MRLIVRPTILHCDVLALYESARIETFAKRFDQMRRARGRRSSQKSDDRHRRLLCARRKRSRSSASEEGDEIAAM
jgi:hypothetical protein